MIIHTLPGGGGTDYSRVGIYVRPTRVYLFANSVMARVCFLGNSVMARVCFFGKSIMARVYILDSH